MTPLRTLALLAVGLTLVGGATGASAQPGGDAGSPGIPGPEAVNPAPGATGAYVGAGPQAFYDVDARIAAVADRIQALPPAQRRRAGTALHQIRAEEATQRARHGELRDWDRESLNTKLDSLVAQFQGLHER